VARCEPNADGDEYSYTIRDVELPINLYAKGCSRVEVDQYAETSYEGVEGVLRRILNTNVLDPSIGTALDFATTTKAFNELQIDNPVLSFARRAIQSFVPVPSFITSTLANYNYNNIPQVVIVVTVRAWGTRDTTRYALQNLAQQLAMMRLNLSLMGLKNNYGANAKLLAGKRASIRHDCVGKFVEVVMAINSQALGQMVLATLNASAGNPLVVNMPDLTCAFPYQQLGPPGFAGNPLGTRDNPHPTSDETPTLAPIPVPGQPPPAQNLNTLNIGPQFGVGFANDGGSRGSYLGLAIPQALLAPCQQSPQPTDPPMIQLPTPPPAQQGPAPSPPKPSPPFVTTVVPWSPP
jgi:hypothetical protein